MLACIATVLAYFMAAILVLVMLVAYGWQKLCELVVYIVGVVGDVVVLPFI